MSYSRRMFFRDALAGAAAAAVAGQTLRKTISASTCQEPVLWQEVA